MRKPRYYYESNFYHLMVQGDEKKFIFNEYNHKKKYLFLMRQNASRNNIKIIAYCIMDNHVHILVFCPELAKLKTFMNETNTSYALYFNKKRKKVGHVFRDRYRSESIYTKSHLINCIKYIHYNPVKANICQKCEQYIFSSYNDLKKQRDILEEICDISNSELMFLLNDSCSNTKFIEDEHLKEDVINAFKDITQTVPYIRGDSKSIFKIYFLLHERCHTTDKEIAQILNISRTTLYRIIKKEKNMLIK